MKYNTTSSTLGVNYHYDKFPPEVNASKLMMPVADAVAAITKYDVKLQQLRDSEILLAPLRRREAVVSSRMEGTITSLEEVLKLEAEQDSNEGTVQPHRHEALEVLSYSSAMKIAQSQIIDTGAITEHLIRSSHRTLLRFTRGKHLDPGEYKKTQNYLADRRKKEVLFTPINPNQLKPHMEKLITYLNEENDHPLIKAAVSHVEFEALHPFNDGNGRLGRMLITLYLWQSKMISAPHFYVSDYFEDHRDEYVDRMRAVSEHDEWTEWTIFFLNGLTTQAAEKCEEIDKIQALYEDMQERFRDVLASKDYMKAVNYVFEKPIFRSTRLAVEKELPKATSARFIRLLQEADLISVIYPPAGRRAGMYSFDPLLTLLRS